MEIDRRRMVRNTCREEHEVMGLCAIDKDRSDKERAVFSSFLSIMMNHAKLIARFDEDLETSVKTIPEGAAAEERENVLAWAMAYVKVKVRGARALSVQIS
jgi:hypothetical protein